MIAFCPKCWKNTHGAESMREMKDVQFVTMKNGRRAAKGICSVCGRGMYKIVKTSEAPAA